MRNRIILPIGSIQEPAPAGFIKLIPPVDHSGVRVNSSVMIRNQEPDLSAPAWFLGRITEVCDATATLVVLESEISPGQPADSSLLGPDAPVYLALNDAFELDPIQPGTEGQMETLLEIDHHQPSAGRMGNGKRTNGKDRKCRSENTLAGE